MSGSLAQRDGGDNDFRFAPRSSARSEGVDIICVTYMSKNSLILPDAIFRNVRSDQVSLFYPIDEIMVSGCLVRICAPTQNRPYAVVAGRSGLCPLIGKRDDIPALWGFTVKCRFEKESPLAFRRIFVNIAGVKSKPSSTRQNKPKQQGNYIDSFVKKMFGQVVVFIDFLLHYADKRFVVEIDVKKIEPAPTHYIGQKGDERIIDMVFRCPLKDGGGSLMAVIVFEHQSKSLKEIPQKLHKYISAIWDAEKKKGKPLSAPYFIVLRTGKKPHRGRYPTMADSLPKGRDGKPLGKAVDVEYDVVDLPNWDFGKLVGGAVLRLVLGMLHKMTGENPDEFPEALKPLSEIADEEQQIELTKELLDFVAKAFAAHNRRVDEVALGKALYPILKGKERTMIKTIFEEREDIGRAEGIAIGKAVGKAEGKVEGKAEGKAEGILTVLRTRFNRIPKDVEKAVLQMTDPIALDSWTAYATTCQTMNEFAKALK